jgi:hypothetical protein
MTPRRTRATGHISLPTARFIALADVLAPSTVRLTAPTAALAKAGPGLPGSLLGERAELVPESADDPDECRQQQMRRLPIPKDRAFEHWATFTERQL